MEGIVGREKEIAQLTEFAHSDRAEFVAVYGRRRVGKTFLVRSAFNDKFVFYATGVIEGTRDQQMEAFNTGLERAGYTGEPATNWMDAFNKLTLLLKKKCSRRTTRQVIFIDELPCFDTPNSGFIPALDFFWNSSASWMDNIMFVVCGSATSWMLKNLIHSHKGLHKRLTHNIPLRPFNLATTEKYCKSRKGKWDRLSILQAYSILGGVPYYLSLLDFNKSVAENIDLMFFSDDAKLKDEYKALYLSMYSNPDIYMAIIELDRSDGIVNICEAKYSRMPYTLSKSEREKIENRESVFQEENPNKQWTQVVIITTKGLKQNTHSAIAQKEVTMDDLFKQLTMND